MIVKYIRRILGITELSAQVQTDIAAIYHKIGADWRHISMSSAVARKTIIERVRELETEHEKLRAKVYKRKRKA